MYYKTVRIQVLYTATPPLHNSILTILAEYFKSVLPSTHSLFVDLPTENPISTIFNSLRPDLVIQFNNKLAVLELTVCHETNFEKAKQRKLNKYSHLENNLNSAFQGHDILLSSVEISVLGFISGLNPFCKLLKIMKVPEVIFNNIT